MTPRTVIPAIALLASACASLHSHLDPKPDHPAHPAAREGLSPAPSRTLELGEAPSSEGTATAGMGELHPMPHGSPLDEKADPGEGHADAALYECPMHPEITSPDPRRRCPKCNMKIDKPVAGGDTEPGKDGHGGHGR